MSNNIMDMNENSNLCRDVDTLELELMKNRRIDPALYEKFDVKRGLRDSNGKGVLTGLTEISDVCSTKVVDGKTIPIDGELYYQGVNVIDLIKGLETRRFGFE